MTLTAADVRKLIKEDDWSTLEMKRHLPPQPSIARLLSAFANKNGGTLLIGVDGEGDIYGLSKAEAHYCRERLLEVAHSLLPAEAVVEIVSVDHRRLVYAAVQSVTADRKPVTTARGKIYERREQETERVPPIEVAVSHPQRRVIVFVAMSFSEETEPALVDYWSAMCRASTNSAVPLKLTRVDLKEGDFEISQSIMAEIDRAEIVIADFTLSSPNVYFEAGYARAKQKRLIQTARKGTNLHFDVRNWRTIFYRNATELEEKLAPALRTAYGEITRAAGVQL